MSRYRATSLLLFALTTSISALSYPVAAAQIDEVLKDLNQPESAAPVEPSSVQSKLQVSPEPGVAIAPLTVPAQPAIPYALLTQGNQQAMIPDWSGITFTSFTFTSSGKLIGSDIERRWSAGQTLDQVMTLGDFQDSLNLEGMNLYATNKALGRDPAGTPAGQFTDALPPLLLNDFKLMERQTIGSLVKALPDLAKLPAGRVAPVADLLRPAEGDPVLASRTLGDLLKAEPNLGTLRFDGLDLSKYRVLDVPGLDHAPFQAFKDWQQAGINDIPGLKDMPWSRFPTPPNQRGIIGRVTIPQATASTSTTQKSDLEAGSISGSNAAGYQVNCERGACPSIGISGSTLLKGKQWFSGAQVVPGGIGFEALANLQDGQEPTGRNIYGDAFKVVLGEIGEANAASSIYFHACESAPGGSQISCSPYAIGPVSFMSYGNGDGIFLGEMNGLAAAPQREPETETASAVSTAPLVVEMKGPHEGSGKAIALLVGLLGLVGGLGIVGAKSLLTPTTKRAQHE